MSRVEDKNFDVFAEKASGSLHDLITCSLELSEELSRKEEGTLTDKEKAFMKATACASLNVLLGFAMFENKLRKENEK